MSHIKNNLETLRTRWNAKILFVECIIYLTPSEAHVKQNHAVIVCYARPSLGHELHKCPK